MYRGFIKDNQNLNGQSLGSPDLRIRSMRINRDILSKATSEFEVVNVPEAASEGNVFGVYDDYGSIVYEGVITSITENVIQTDQIIALFDDDWLWSNPAQASIEETVVAIIENDWAMNTDTMLQNIFSQFTVTAETQDVALQLPSQDDNFVTNFMEFIFQLYEAYEILLDITVAYNDTAPTIQIYKPSYTKILLGNNTNAVRNFDITTETFETNKIVVYSKDGTEYRGSWYGTTSGITTNSAAGNRLPKINTKYVFSDDPTDDIVGEYLTDNMYNHKINVELVLANKLYNFDDFKLGQEFDIFYNDTYYNSILTGYKINVDSEGKAEIVTLVFGKVRYSLENKLYKLSQSNNASSSSGGGGGGGGTSDYSELENKPSINGIVLVGNKTSADLGLDDGKAVLAWTNPDGDATGFSTKTVTLTGYKASDYSYYEVIFNGLYNAAVYVSTGRLPVGEPSSLFYLAVSSSNYRIRAREVTASTDSNDNIKLTFAQGYQWTGGSTTGSSNNICIPVYILLYK